MSHGDAAEFCGHHGDRLPESWEWQWAAQVGQILQGELVFDWSDCRARPGGPGPGGTRRTRPACPPSPGVVSTAVCSAAELCSGRELPAPDSVDSHPAGASWAGLQDLVGNVYQWTSVFTDLHTSRAVLRGGPHWRPGGSHWYQVTEQPYSRSHVPPSRTPGCWRTTSGPPGRCTNTTPTSSWRTGSLQCSIVLLSVLLPFSLDRSGQIGFRCVRDTAP